MPLRSCLLIGAGRRIRPGRCKRRPASRSLLSALPSRRSPGFDLSDCPWPMETPHSRPFLAPLPYQTDQCEGRSARARGRGLAAE